MPSTRRPLLALILLIAGAGAAAAQTPADFDRIDTNKDSSISAAEFDVIRARDFMLIDANRDGSISRTEFVGQRAALPSRETARERRFREMDTNGDGRVSREEYLAFGRQQFTTLDRDRNGNVSRAEFEAAIAGSAVPPPSDRPARRQDPAAEREALRASFARIDANGDGTITPAELEAARLEAFRQMDADGNGQLSRDEITRARGPAAIARMTAMDTNRDSTVSRAEYIASGQRLFRAADRNGDGRLSFEEFASGGAG